MATDLPDVNVWVALSDTFHVHHKRATEFWDKERSASAAFCGVTATGMMRILTLPSAMGGRPFNLPDAVKKYREFAVLPEIGFLKDSPNVCSRVEDWAREPFFTGKLWTDAWIAALAMENGCRVVSFDSDFGKFPGLDFLRLGP